MREVIQQQATEAIINNKWKNSIIVVAPRVGKTKLCIDAMKLDNIDTLQVLIVAPYKTIIESWKREFSMWNLEFKGKLTTNASLSKCDVSKYKYVIVDEIQELSPNNIQYLKKFSNVIGLTGTLSISNRQILLKELKLNVVYEYTIEQAIEDKIIADYRVHIYYLELDNVDKVIDISPKGSVRPLVTEKVAYDHYTKMFEKMKYAAQFNPALHTIKQLWASKRAQLIYNLPSKLKIAKRLVAAKLASDNKRLIVFTQSQAMSDSICHSYHSANKNDDNLDKFIKGNIQALSTVNMVSLGVTIPNLKQALAVQLQSNDETSIQRLARVLNPEDSKTGFIEILCCRGSVDEIWLTSALSGLSETKITWNNWNNNQ